MNTQTSQDRFPRFAISTLGLAIWGLYALGTFFPDTWWTTHWLAFLPPLWKYGLLGVAAMLIVFPMVDPQGLEVPKAWERLTSWKGIHGLIALLVGLIIYLFPMADDYYGDAYKILGLVDNTIDAIPKGTNEAFFNMSLSPWEGHKTVLSLVTYIAFFGGIPYSEAFLWLGLVCGVLFVWMWLSFVGWYLKDPTWRGVAGLAGLSAPFMLLFFGHYESYAPVFLLFMAWLLGLLMFLETGKTAHFWGLLGLLLLCFKVHPVSLLFVPALVLAALHHFGTGGNVARYLLSGKGVALGVIVPLFVVGAVLYFFVFEDYRDSRDLMDVRTSFDRLFLPLLSPEPPLDRYNLLSFNHIFDYLMLSLIWSPVGVLALGIGWMGWRKDISFDTLPWLLAGLTFLLFASFFFVVNPILSMQLDWDLMAIPALPFLALVLVLIKSMETRFSGSTILPIALGLTLLSIPSWIIHTDKNTFSERLESLGVRMYKTYYGWSAEALQYALDMPLYASREAYEERKEALLNKLEPFTQPGVDYAYARLLATEARFHIRNSQDYERALEYLDQAKYYHPNEENLPLLFMEVHFLKKDYLRAYSYSEELVERAYPSKAKALRIAVQCALEAGLYGAAQGMSDRFLREVGANPVMEKVFNTISKGGETDSLVYLFERR